MTDQTIIQASDGRLNMTTAQADALRNLGTVKDTSTEFSMEQIGSLLEQLPDLAVCDFCSETPVTDSFDAEDFGNPIAGSVGGWAACEPCAALIREGDQEALLARSVDVFMEKNPGAPRVHVQAGCAIAQNGFWAHRKEGA